MPGRPRAPVSASIRAEPLNVVSSMARALSSARSAAAGMDAAAEVEDSVRSGQSVGMPCDDPHVVWRQET